MSHEKVLVIEDDEDIQELFNHHLVKEGYRVTIASSGEDGADVVSKGQFDCVLLDLMLPGMDGLDVCKMMKKSPRLQHIPVIMVTAKGEETDIVSGLELGADDYIIKPFSPKVLIARVRATLRRKSREAYNSDAVLNVNNLEIHPGKHEVVMNHEKLDLTRMEFQVLHLLASHQGWVFTRNQIIDSIRDDNYQVTDRSVDVIIVGLRRKLGAASEHIETVRGVGYRFLEQ